ncbi:tyrosine-protein phosphatase [Sulfitobacter sp. M57]|uniref:tyrosine-protein phosphatase n=1 Tax=unclassified Sulfitobacter TaxID=196795 RepID=UPI0023E1B936|nr:MULTISPECIES: tyrosine-protein phosphatase [unclassified Sulfitobacter]MDF3412924.1 tyrosine-protein phosphatase [Sulfitobacter sp. KE5]MDF3421792.1 tyrosine-protein phosphatase [Sulfitobacter sp. KE43]MDF3431473.1 tyrosine-protein phosphatase [Sulfitobacter sp. KE42]MDF3457114.1 tyrosine-protein phosphatase [Sulfitobacter sp. S74]MDF3461017.1 tyrosine-protein phosphatase [Sulfitobacter sp. Ks18]
MKDMPRHIAIGGTYNIRDLGGYITARGTAIPPRRFLRADCLHRLEPGGTDHLLAEGLRCVIDLRTRREVTQAPSQFNGLEGVDYVNLPLFDDLSPAALAYAGAAHLHPLVPFYITALDTRAAAVRAILTRIASVQDGAVLFNCTAGKDRTGIIAALLLGLAGVSDADIIQDYVLTEQLIPDLVAEFLSLSRANGGDVVRYATLLESPADTMEKMLLHIATQYGGVRDYVLQTGVDATDLIRLQDRLCGGRS